MNRQVIYYHGHRYTRSHYRSYENNRCVSIVEMRRHDSPRWQDAVCIGVSKHYGIPFRAKPDDAGCYVDGTWGTYATAHMVHRAREFGYDQAEVTALADRHMDEHVHGGITHEGIEPLTTDEYWELAEAGQTGGDVENWLNEHIAPEGYSFGWHDGEFFLQSAEWRDE